jgi:hypothetical protein
MIPKYRIRVDDFFSITKGLIYYKVGDIVYDNPPLKHLYEEKRKYEDYLVNLNSLQCVRYVSKSDIYSKIEESDNRSRIDSIHQTIKIIDQKIQGEITYFYNEHLYDITEICISHTVGHEGLYKLEDGCIHSLEGPAYYSLNSNHRQYFIYGKMMDYEEWKKHPLVRRKKIEKVRQKWT